MEKENLATIGVGIIILIFFSAIFYLIFDRAQTSESLEEYCIDNEYEGYTSIGHTYRCCKKIPSKSGLGYNVECSGIINDEWVK